MLVLAPCHLGHAWRGLLRVKLVGCLRPVVTALDTDAWCACCVLLVRVVGLVGVLAVAEALHMRLLMQ